MQRLFEEEQVGRPNGVHHRLGDVERPGDAVVVAHVAVDHDPRVLAGVSAHEGGLVALELRGLGWLFGHVPAVGRKTARADLETLEAERDIVVDLLRQPLLRVVARSARCVTG
jgi:hypothetical protein